MYDDVIWISSSYWTYGWLAVAVLILLVIATYGHDSARGPADQLAAAFIHTTQAAVITFGLMVLSGWGMDLIGVRIGTTDDVVATRAAQAQTIACKKIWATQPPGQSDNEKMRDILRSTGVIQGGCWTIRGTLDLSDLHGFTIRDVMVRPLEENANGG